MTTHTFLTDEWLAEVRAAQEARGGAGLDEPGMVVNATITGVPFGEPVRQLHSVHGPVVGWTEGHAADPTVALTLDYALARELVLDPGFDVLEQAIDGGGLRIDGDPGALRTWWRHRIGNPDAVALDDEVRGRTA